MLDSDFICKTTRTQFLSPDGYSLHSLHGKDMKGHQGKPPPMLLLCPQQLPELGRDLDFLMLSAVFSPLCYILHRT